MGDQFNKPNVVIPLAMSYDTRNIASRTYAQAGKDQRKVNCFYDIINNSGTGNRTLELVKRPGFYPGATLGGTVGTTYLILDMTGLPGIPWVFGFNSGTNVTSVQDNSGANTIVTSASVSPRYAYTTSISGTKTAVLQLAGASSAAHRVFYASTIGSWTEITDSDFTGLVHRGMMVEMDGYQFVMDQNSRIYNSDLNSLANWNPSNFVTKQITNDRPYGLAKFKNQILAFSQNSVEVFRNAGNPSGSPLSTVKELAADVGLGLIAEPDGMTFGSAYTRYYDTLGERLYFVGHIAGGRYAQQLIAYNGQSFQPIDNGPMNRIIGQSAVQSVNRVGFNGKNAIAIELSNNGPVSAWIMYFPDINEFFEWSSDETRPLNNGENFLGSAAKTFQFSNSNQWVDNNSTAYTMTVQFRLPKRSNNRDFMHWCALDADTTTSASNVTVEFSDDDYQSFSAGRTIDLNTPEKRINRCGSYKTPRVVRLSHSANVEFRARNFLARVE